MSSVPPQPEAAPETPPQIPDLELLRRIGQGSYGEVWLARTATGAYRAVKVVYRRTFDHDRPYEREFAGLKRFEPISRTSPNQLAILHVGRNDAAGYFFYEMELADDVNHGQDINPGDYVPRTLAHDLRRRAPLPVAECLEIGRQLAQALEHLHTHRLVHRDVKPSNIVFVSGVPKLADIGLVTGVDATRSYLGTEGYIPPEGPGTPPADLYSLGKVLYEMSTGRDRSDFPELPTALRGSPDREQLALLNRIVLRACAQDCRARYQTAAELRTALEKVKTGASQPSPLRARIGRWPKPGRIVAMAAVLLAIVAGWLVWSRPQLVVVQRWPQPRGQPAPRAKPARLDASPGLELLATETNVLRAYAFDGRLGPSWTCARPSWQYLVVGLVTNAELDFHDEVFASWTAGANPGITVLGIEEVPASTTVGTNLGTTVSDRVFKELKHFAAIGREPHTRNEGATSTLGPSVVFKSRDGKKLLLAIIDTQYGLNPCPRGLYCFDYETGVLLWKSLTGPKLYTVLAADLDGDGEEEFVCGSHAPDNGNKGPDGTDDSHSYVFLFARDGTLKWKRELSGPLSVTQPLLAQLDGDPQPELIAWVYTDEYRHVLGRYTLALDDIQEISTLARNVKQPSREIDRYLARQLSPTTREALVEYEGPGEGATIKQGLVKDLNALILGRESLYGPQRFAGVKLRQETEELLARVPQGDAREHLNRLLLEDAYQHELSRLGPKPSPDSRQEKPDPRVLGQVVQLDPQTGKVIKRYPKYPARVCLKSCIVANVDGKGPDEILCSDCEGNLHQLTPDFTEDQDRRRRFCCGPPKRPDTFDYVNLILNSTTRLLPGGQVHVLVWSDVVRMETFRPQGPPDEHADPRVNDAPELLILNARLRMVASHPATVGAHSQWQPPLADMDGDHLDEILVPTTNHIEVLKLRRWQDRFHPTAVDPARRH